MKHRTNTKKAHKLAAPASGKQLRFIGALAEQAGVPKPRPTTRDGASREIDRLKNTIYRQSRRPRALSAEDRLRALEVARSERIVGSVEGRDLR